MSSPHALFLAPPAPRTTTDTASSRFCNRSISLKAWSSPLRLPATLTTDNSNQHYHGFHHRRQSPSWAHAVAGVHCRRRRLDVRIALPSALEFKTMAPPPAASMRSVASSGVQAIQCFRPGLPSVAGGSAAAGNHGDSEKVTPCVWRLRSRKEKMRVLGGEEGFLGGFFGRGVNSFGLQPRSVSQNRFLQSAQFVVAEVPSMRSSSNHWKRTCKVAACLRGRMFRSTITSRLAGGASWVAWICGDDGLRLEHGSRKRLCAVHAQKDDDINYRFRHDHEELRRRYEIHGRRIRVGRPTPQGPNDNIMMQGFTWESHKGSKYGKKWWQVLKAQVEEICELGVTEIWLPPVSQSVDKQGYLPGELYNLDASKYGTGVHLKELIDELHHHGICVIADIVINHRSGILQDNKGHWNIFKGGNRDKRLDWGPWAVVDDDVYDGGGKGHHDTGESYAGAPDLDHTNKQVQDELTDWMNWLKAEIGFDGWRFDFVKGYAPKYTKLYCLRTNPTIAVGELWTSMAYSEGQLSLDQNGHRQQLCDWIDGTDGVCCAFDFTTKGILQKALEDELWRLKDAQGQPPGLIGWWPQKSVTFIDNHDTGSTQRHWAFPDKLIIQGYAYILTHPGIPCIFYDHVYEFKLMNEIKMLLQLRKRHRINAISKVSIQKAEADIYVAKIDDRVILKLGTRFDMGSLLPEKDLWNMTLAGKDYAIWETTAPLPPLPVAPVAPEAPEAPVEARENGESKIHPFHPTQPIHITNKMSDETRNRILTEVPELVDPVPNLVTTKISEETRNQILTEVPELVDSVPELVDPMDTPKKSNRREQDHVHKKMVETPPSEGTTTVRKAERKPEVATPAENVFNEDGTNKHQTLEALTHKGKPQTEYGTAVSFEKAHPDKGNGLHNHPGSLPEVPTLKDKSLTEPGTRAFPPKTLAEKVDGTEKLWNKEQHRKDIHITPEVHGRRTIPGRPTPSGPYGNVMIQAFNWESHNKTKDDQSWWTVLRTKVKDFASVGITDVWLPPVSQSVDRQGYLPSELYNLDASCYGTSVQLMELIDELHIHGMCVIADIVINHRCGGLQDNKGHWNIFKGGNQDRRLDWGPWAVVDDDVYDGGGKGHHHTGENYAAAPDLDHTNKQVQDELTDWMNWLKVEIGFDGWRFDFVKGYSPKFTNLYCTRTNPTISVGELWTPLSYHKGQLAVDQNGHRQKLCDWIDETEGFSCVFDFTTKGILQHAVQNELWRLVDSQQKPPGLIGWYPQKAVTFIHNHDTGSTQRHWVFPDKKIELGYAYILTHPGIPCIFIDHLYEFKLKDEIQKLVELRMRNHINANSKVVIQKAEANIYIAKIDDQVILKLGSRVDMDGLVPDDSIWKVAMTGPEFCIWESTKPPPLAVEEVESDQITVTFEPFQPTQHLHLTTKSLKRPGNEF